MNKEDLTLNNLQWYAIKPNQTISNLFPFNINYLFAPSQMVSSSAI